jgi:hypothetical protein
MLAVAKLGDVQDVHTGCGGNFLENIHLGRKTHGKGIIFERSHEERL